MPRGVSDKAKPWEKFLMILVKGGEFTKQEILDTIDYEFGDRLSAFAWNTKLEGGVIRVKKDGRKVVSYELLNVEEMKQYLSKRGLIEKKSTKKVKSLDELKTETVETKEEEIA